MNNSGSVVTLRPFEGISIDSESLARLRESGCEVQGAARTGELLEDLALGLSRIAIAYRNDRFEDLCAGSQKVAQLATKIGLDRLGRVAGTVAALSRGSDSVALAANLARLMRLGNDALGAIWDLQDQSM